MSIMHHYIGFNSFFIPSLLTPHYLEFSSSRIPEAPSLPSLRPLLTSCLVEDGAPGSSSKLAARVRVLHVFFLACISPLCSSPPNKSTYFFCPLSVSPPECTRLTRTGNSIPFVLAESPVLERYPACGRCSINIFKWMLALVWCSTYFYIRVNLLLL